VSLTPVELRFIVPTEDHTTLTSEVCVFVRFHADMNFRAHTRNPDKSRFCLGLITTPEEL
jgi:hypothetical protein